VHVPRTGGLAIAEVIGRPEGFAQNITHWSVQNWKCELGDERYDAAFTFAVVRHPCDRLLSAYSYLTQQTQENVYRPEYWEFDAGERKFLETFESFEQLVMGMPESLTRSPGMEHFLMQCSLLADSKGFCGVKRLFRFENMAEVERELSKLTGNRIKIPVVNSSKHRHWNQEYTQPMMERVKELYWPDFELLEYDI
jgi:hypothetical protein